MTLWHKFTIEPPFDPLTYDAILDIPGATIRGYEITAAANAAWLVEEALVAHQKRFTIRTEDRLPKGLLSGPDDLRYLVPAGFRERSAEMALPYQREAIQWCAQRAGSAMWHSPGCLAGDTQVVVNRGGCARTMDLSDLVFKFNGGGSPHGVGGTRRWDLSIPTYVQSIDEETGFIGKNLVIGAVASGVKMTYTLRTDSGHEIRATADHLFPTAEGWAKLSELSVGQEIAYEKWPEALGDKTPYKPRYEEMQHMWNHPHAVLRMRGQAKGGKEPKRTATIAMHRLVMEAHINGITLAELVGRIVLNQIEGLTFLEKGQEVHHKNKNPKDNRLENLELMDSRAHLSLHGKEDGWKHVSARGAGTKIVSIEPYGEEETFDLCMEAPRNNYIANGLVVHNSGKTFSAIAWALHSRPPYIIVTKAAARHQFAGEVKNFTTLRPVVIEGGAPIDFNALAARSYERAVMPPLPPDERKRRRRRGWEYEPDNAPLGSVGFFILGWEILPYHAEALVRLRSSAVVFDELHRAKSTKRIKASVDTDGKLVFEKRNNVASAAMDVARGAGRRLGTTATPVKDRVRDLWAQMDLLEPCGWGPFWRVVKEANGSEGRPSGFASRYCSGHAGTFGGVDSSGQSHLDELDARVTFVSHIVPRSITHRDLPPKRRMVTWIAPSDQSTPPPEFKKIMKEAARIGGTALLEAQFQEAAARKRKFVLDHLVSALEGDQKVVVLTGRHKDCESLGADLKKACDKEDIKLNAFVVSHGGNTTTGKRNDLMLEYMRAEGPAVIVGTLDAWGESVNLQDTDLAAFVMLPYTPSMLEQAEGRFCIAAGQPVLTRRGVVPIEQVVVGDQVWSHKGRWCRVTDTSSQLAANKKQFITEIDYMHHGLPLRCTSDHRVFVERRDTGVREWAEASTVRPCDYMLLAQGAPNTATANPVLTIPASCRKHGRGNGRHMPAPEQIEVTLDVAYLFGVFLGDGWARTAEGGGRRIGISGNDTTKVEMLARCRRAVEAWGFEFTMRDPVGHSHEMVLYSADLAEWFAQLFGQEAHNKTVPDCVFSWPRAHIEAFVEGYFRADGHRKTGRPSTEWTSASPHLGLQIPLLLAKIDRVGSCTPMPSRKEGHSAQYYGSAYDTDNKGLVVDGYVRHVVRSVTNGLSKKINNVRERVYDIEVEGDESFTVGLAAVHNCRHGQKRPVTIQYFVAEGTADERVASILLDKLPAVARMGINTEADQIADGLAGLGSDQDVIASLLGKITSVVEEGDEYE